MNLAIRPCTSKGHYDPAPPSIALRTPYFCTRVVSYRLYTPIQLLPSSRSCAAVPLQDCHLSFAYLVYGLRPVALPNRVRIALGSGVSPDRPMLLMLSSRPIDQRPSCSRPRFPLRVHSTPHSLQRLPRNLPKLAERLQLAIAQLHAARSDNPGIDRQRLPHRLVRLDAGIVPHDEVVAPDVADLMSADGRGQPEHAPVLDVADDAAVAEDDLPC